MNNYIGSRKQVDEYIGNRVVVAGYQGSRKYFDAFNTVSGAPPLVFNSRVQQVLRNYTVYGSSEGAGVETSGTEPAGYKIPLTVTSGAQSQDISIYIGSSKLGEEEYVDFGEQKVYKRTENLYDYMAQDTENGFVDGSYLIESGGTRKGPIWDISEYIEVEPNTIYTLTPRNASLSPSIVEYNAHKQYIAGHSYGGNEAVTITTGATTKYVRASVPKNNLSTILFVKGDTLPGSYIPYLNPQDPPVPLPAINTYQGENTLSSTETLGECSVTGKINV